MDTDVTQLATRFLRGYGIADCPIDVSMQRIGQPYRGGDAPLELVESTCDAAAALEYLTTFSSPASRHVAFAAGTNCTGFINNSLTGSDYADHVVWLGRLLGARFARIVSRDDDVWSNGTERVTRQYAATVFQLSSDGELIRSVLCLHEGGRWTFGESGERHLVEHQFPYDARRKKDRFGPEQLAQLAAAYGIPTLQPRDLLHAGRYYLIRSTWKPTSTFTLAEADDPAYRCYINGLYWVSHIETHASSVVALFERCLQLNPDYEPKVRDALEKAYDILNSQGEG